MGWGKLLGGWSFIFDKNDNCCITLYRFDNPIQEITLYPNPNYSGKRTTVIVPKKAQKENDLNYVRIRFEIPYDEGLNIARNLCPELHRQNAALGLNVNPCGGYGNLKIGWTLYFMMSSDKNKVNVILIKESNELS